MSENNIQSAKAGFIAGTIQTSSLIWLRVINKYQYRYGYSIHKTISKLYKSGGLPRFVKGVIPATIDSSLCRMGDIFIYSYVKENYTNESSLKQSSLIGIYSSFHKCLLTPLDTLAVNYHVYGNSALKKLKTEIGKNGILSLYNGGVSILGLSAISSTIWFSFFINFENYTKKYIDERNKSFINGLNGAAASVSSTLILNPIHALKTYRQTKHLSYINSLKDMIDKTSLINSLYRGISSRLMIKTLQSSLFVVLWKHFEST